MLRILQIGAGSMGNRRLRDLSKLQDVQLALLDQRPDRRANASRQYGIPVFEDIDSALFWKPDALIISTPPDMHDAYIELALDQGYHHFCEENIWTYDYKKVETISNEKNLVSIPSCSLHYMPVIKGLRRMVEEELGTLHAYQTCLSTYAPTWHPDEGNEFYARQRSTCPAREMVPFELVCYNSLFGIPEYVAGSVSKRGELPHYPEDIWSLQMKLQNGVAGQLIVIMGCPHTIRNGWIAGSNGIIRFDILTGEVVRSLPGIGINDVQHYGNFLEVLQQSYAEEIHTFIDVLHGKKAWPHSYELSAYATGTLAAAEKSAITGIVEKVSPDFQPALYPDQY